MSIVGRNLIITLCLLLSAQLGFSPYASAARLWHLNSRTCAPHLASLCAQHFSQRRACAHCPSAPTRKGCDCQSLASGSELPDLAATVVPMSAPFALALNPLELAWQCRTVILCQHGIEAHLGLPPPLPPPRANLLRGSPSSRLT